MPTRTNSPGQTFVAIDFETADRGFDSACSVGLVRVEGGKIVERIHELIRPPRQEFLWTHIHGITWEDVADEDAFGEVWPRVARVLDGVEFIAAHNAGFDRGVLSACCRDAGLSPPPQPFVCTVALARRTWRLRRANLAAVCEHLRIPLRHHEALSDAEACARIVLAAAVHADGPQGSGYSSAPSDGGVPEASPTASTSRRKRS